MKIEENGGILETYNNTGKKEKKSKVSTVLSTTGSTILVAAKEGIHQKPQKLKMQTTTAR